MKTLEEIRRCFAQGKVELTVHALKRVVQRNISMLEIAEVANNVELIEDYPDDKYFPSCLLLGFTRTGRPLHLHISRMEGKDVRFITVYEPNPREWVDNYRKRL